MGAAHELLGDLPRAFTEFDQALAIARHANNFRGEAMALASLARASARSGDFDKAADYGKAALQQYERMGSADSELLRQQMESWSH